MYPILIALALSLSAPQATGEFVAVSWIEDRQESFVVDDLVEVLGEMLDGCMGASTSTWFSDSIYRTPAEELRRQAAAIERRDALIAKARELHDRAERVLRQARADMASTLDGP